jgi:hypothetical protein
MDTGGKSGIKALCKPLAESDLLWQILESLFGELLIQAMKPVAEIGPLFVSFEVFEKSVDVSLQILVFS